MSKRKKVIAIRGKEVKEFPSMVHASYFAGYNSPRGIYSLLKSKKREKNGWKFVLKENIE